MTSDLGRSPSSLSDQQLGSAFRRLATEHADAQSARNEDTWEHILARTSGAHLRVVDLHPQRRRAIVWGAASLAVAAVALFAFWPASGANLTYTVRTPGSLASAIGDEGVVGVGERLIAAENSPMEVRFSDAVRVVVAPHSTLRMEVKPLARDSEEGRHEVVVRLAQGEMTVHSPPRSSAAPMAVIVGRYRMESQGASFHLAYVPGTEHLDVKVVLGRVSLMRGTDAPRILTAGQSVAWESPRGDGVLAREPASQDDSAPANGGKEGGPSASVGVRAPAGVLDRGTSFQSLAAEGRFADVVASASRQDIERVLAQFPASELHELGQAARYTGDLRLAKRVWTRMTARFPGTPSARNARFFLGRLAEQEGRVKDALAAYDLYLKEGPAGLYSMEALGRKLVLVHKTQGVQGARPLADEYLQRYPRGPYSERARELRAGK